MGWGGWKEKWAGAGHRSLTSLILHTQQLVTAHSPHPATGYRSFSTPSNWLPILHTQQPTGYGLIVLSTPRPTGRNVQLSCQVWSGGRRLSGRVAGREGCGGVGSVGVVGVGVQGAVGWWLGVRGVWGVEGEVGEWLGAGVGLVEGEVGGWVGGRGGGGVVVVEGEVDGWLEGRGLVVG